MLATEPPLTNKPPAVDGSPDRRHNHRIIPRSTAAAADPPNHVPLKILKPAASASAIVLTKLFGPGTNAKSRGWSTWKLFAFGPGPNNFVSTMADALAAGF